MQFLPACWGWKGKILLSFPSVIPLFSQYLLLLGPVLVLEPWITWFSSLTQQIPTMLMGSLPPLDHIRKLGWLADRSDRKDVGTKWVAKNKAGNRRMKSQPETSVLLNCTIAWHVLKSRWAAPWFKGSADEGTHQAVCRRFLTVSTRWPALNRDGKSPPSPPAREAWVQFKQVMHLFCKSCYPVTNSGNISFYFLSCSEITEYCTHFKTLRWF